MIGFNYEFLTFSTAYDGIKIILNYSIIEISILVVSLIFILSLMIYILPIISIYCNYSKQNALKIKNKKMLRRIALQKDIEDAIAEELKLANN